MFAKLKKKLAEDMATTTSRPGGAARMPRSVSKESITSGGVDSGDDFPSDGSSSREDLSSQLFRRNEQIRKLEIKLSDYAEQVRNLQKIKEKLEKALETHQDSFVKKLQEQNEAHQGSTAKMAEDTALALEKKDQEWKEKLSRLEKLLKEEEEEEEQPLARLEQGVASSAEELSHAREALQLSQSTSARLSGELQELKRQHLDLQAERDELREAEESAEKKIRALELRGQELHTYVQRLSAELQNAQGTTSGCEKRLEALQGEQGGLEVGCKQHTHTMVRALEEKTRLAGGLEEKVATLEKRLLEGNLLSGDPHVRELIRESTELEQERARLQERVSSLEHQRTAQVAKLEEQITSLESEQVATQHNMRQLEKKNGALKERCRDLGNSLKSRESELERLKAELSIAAEKSEALEEAQEKQKEALQHQVAALASSLKEKELIIAERTASLLKEEEEGKHRRQDREAALLQMHHLHSSLELCQSQAAQREAVAEEHRKVLQAQLKATREHLVAREQQVATLESASKALRPPEGGEGEPNGEVAAMDVLQLQKENRGLEQQLAEKNKIIKQLQQRMAELKKTLQKELKIRPDGEIPPELPSSAAAAALTVTNTSDLNDSREVNFEYLKHVVLKFMSCREAEAFHLIKAMSVLLNFSTEEENMLKETLEYKMSWFGSKPPPRGSVRPSISSPRSAWS